MSQIKYTGRLKSNQENISNDSAGISGNESTSECFVSNLYISNKQIVRCKNQDYVFGLDGIIYEFDNRPFQGDNYSQLMYQLARDPQRALRLINGEFVLFLFHVTMQRMIVATSVSGNAAFFYRKSSSSVSFSNSMSEIQNLGDSPPTIRLQRIFDILTANNLGSAETCFSDILRLLPGRLMEMKKNTISISNYSDPFQNSARVSIVDDPYVEFRSIFRRALVYRMRATNIGIALSSGKDSTAVAAMADSVIRDNQKISSYTFYPTFLPKKHTSDYRYNENILLQSFLKKYPGIDARKVEAPTGSVLSSMERSLKIYGEPVYGVSNQYWIQKMHGMMDEDGCEIMLTGQGGNYTISWPPPELVSTQKAPRHSFLKKLIRLINYKAALPYMTKDFLNGVSREYFISSFESPDIHHLQPLLIKNSLSYTGYLQKQVSLYHGFQITDPTLDRHLIEFCLKLPFEGYHDSSLSRKLVTHGLKEMMPDDIRNNTIRSLQASDIQYRLEQERGNFIEKLEFLNNNKLVTFVLETEKLLKDWDSMDFSRIRRKELNHMLRLILVGMFLSKFKDII